MDLGRSDRIPTVMSVMTPFPHTIDVEQPLEHAREAMRQLEIRHLPVTEEGRLVGVVSEREAALVQSSRPLGERLNVSHACLRDAYVVEINEPLDVVAREMARRHTGSALVVKDGRLAGIFTATDACQCLGDLLRSRSGGGSPDAA
jgi:acetoin utilization protein AcuB